MKTMTRKSKVLLSVLLTVLALMMAMTMMATTAFADTTDEATEVSVAIPGHNLSLQSNIQIVYYVSVSNADIADVELLIWDAAQTSYTKGTEAYALKYDSKNATTTTPSGETAYPVYYTELAAKQMTDNVYARAYINVDGAEYYSDLDKYSILQYAYAKKDTTDEKLAAVINSTLAYGAAAQNYFDYNTDRLANAEYYQISTVNGTIADGTTSGLFATGETVDIVAPAINDEYGAFFFWSDSSYNQIPFASTTVTVGEADETYTAAYTPSTIKDTYVTYIAGDIAAEDINAWNNGSYFIADAAGTYTFFLPQGCGFSTMAGIMSGTPELACTDNTAGESVSVVLEAGQQLSFGYTATIARTVVIVVSYSEEIASAEPETPNYGTLVDALSATVTDNGCWVDVITYTAAADGEYTFTLPAGLGAWDEYLYDNDWSSAPYADYYDNTSGASFTLTLAAGETTTFYIAHAEKGDYTIKVYYVETIAATVTDNGCWVDVITYTAAADGEYTFTLPAGLGAWDEYLYDNDYSSAPYVDYYENESGASFTLTLAAGETTTFYIAHAEKGDYTIKVIAN